MDVRDFCRVLDIVPRDTGLVRRGRWQDSVGYNVTS